MRYERGSVLGGVGNRRLSPNANYVTIFRVYYKYPAISII